MNKLDALKDHKITATLNSHRGVELLRGAKYSEVKNTNQDFINSIINFTAHPVFIEKLNLTMTLRIYDKSENKIATYEIRRVENE